jgi:HSP20 family protein
MANFPWKPLRMSLDLDRQIEDVFSQIIHRPWGSLHAQTGWRPEIDLYETDDAYLIEADLPGVRPEEVAVRISDRWVTISGTRQLTTWSESAKGVSLERRSGSFTRTFRLEFPVDSERVERRQAEGIHQIRIPKKKQ